MAYTTIDDPSAHFQVQLYSGNGGTQSITNTGNSALQPDWVWLKRRDGTDNNSLFDSTRGVTKELNTNGSNPEGTASNLITSFDSDGFGLGDNGGVNGNGESYVAWQWKANGGTTSSNTDGSLTSTVQANTTAGFSIVTYSNPSTNNNTIGHGLGVQPEIIIFKNTVDTIDWYVASKYLSNYTTKYLELNTNDAEATHSDGMNSTAPTSSVFSVGGISRTGDNGNKVVAYCIAEKQGYSKVGTYYGNGQFDGTFAYCGFKPAWIMIKSTGASEPWVVYDTERNPHNGADLKLTPNTEDGDNGNSQVGGTSNNIVDILSTGFKMRSNNNATNQSSTKFIFVAFAEHPFVSSSGVPNTAR